MDPDLKLRVEWDEARAAFIDAKKNSAKDPDGYAAAKKAMQTMRTHWRRIRDAVGGGAMTETITTKTGSN